MFRGYFLIKHLEPLKQTIDELESAEVGHNRIHVMAKDPQILEQKGILATTPWEDTDIMPSGYHGAWRGFWVGLIAGFLMISADPFGVDIGVPAWLFITALCTSFGAWLGGMVGLSQVQHDLRPYVSRVKNGYFLMLVDVDREVDLMKVQAIIHRHQEFELSNVDTHFSPLAY